ncbi:ATP-binding cassette domain-containing protein [Pseudonocardia kujensis]|uniref:ATP-binding cassette domain-containing protein n=1 Tax=Pseudonocardia kujensis TaxID=1128675 RepID=UPI001E31EAD6|nr:ATP-binding cassette domain-containing protein [Pseudonocardia kujensis]MCE0764103.1 ATP-binding cassette domain-containing protein [Pseudonocardia kujensis]
MTGALETADAPAVADGTPALELRGISKSYGAVTALHQVDLTVTAGEVHALVGENGAGKSTLIGVAAGAVIPDSGSVVIGGRPLAHATPAAAREMGVAVVYQDPAILDALTVAENLLLAAAPVHRSRRAATREWVATCLERVGLQVDPRQRAAELGPAQRQLLEIAKALDAEPAVLILDEPTESLAADDVERLFALVRGLAAAGTAVVYISHRIAEVRRIADRITTLRDGRIRGTSAAEGIDDDAIVEMIVGRSLEAVFPARADDIGAATLTVTGLGGTGFTDVDLTVHAGEIVGLAGVEGNGQREFLRALAGLNPATTGTLALGGTRIEPVSAAAAAAAGVRFVPADRLREGVAAALSVRENVAIGSLSRFATAGVVRTSTERRAVEREMAATSVKAASPETGILTLSGGNQQKVVLARMLLAEPTVVLCDEPTRGVDVGARAEIYGLLRGLAERGKPVVVLSADAAELAGLCDRVVVFSRGQVQEVLSRDDLTEDRITGTAVRATGGRADLPATDAPPRERRSRLSRADAVAAPVLLLLAAVLAGATAALVPAFLGPLNIELLLYAVAALAFVAVGQLAVVLTGGIDLAVGPLAGLLVVVMSFVLAEGTDLVTGLLVALAVALGVGLVNGALVAVVELPPIVATLATSIAAQGAALLLRPQAGGSIDGGLTTAVQTAVGGTPVVFGVAVVLAVGADLVLRRTRVGVALRAVGPDRGAATRIGVRARSTVLAAYLACAVCTLLGALLLGAQIGVGDPSQGGPYTLTSISAVIIAGAGVRGGRGSFVAALCGALLLGVISNATSFLGLGQYWQFWLPGAVILLAVALSVRRARSAH